MGLRHLRYFVAVAEEQNVTRAAARLHVSQPPLSRQIRDLEDGLGVTLFERSARSVRLTEAGRVFLMEARAVLARAEEATQTVKAIASGKRGEIHVGYAPMVVGVARRKTSLPVAAEDFVAVVRHLPSQLRTAARRSVIRSSI